MTRYVLPAMPDGVARTTDVPWQEPPSDLDGEEGVIGSMLADPACGPRVAGIIHCKDFTDSGYRRIYRLLTRLSPGDRSPEALRAELHAVVGEAYVEALTDCVPSGANAAWYARRVRDAYRRRRIISAAAEATREAYDGSVSAARAALTDVLAGT